MKDNQEAETMLQDIESNYHGDLREQRYKALLKWSHCMGDKATMFVLDSVLRECDCSHLADGYTKPVMESEGVMERGATASCE